METQRYEEYWKLTLEYSDIYEQNFNNCLEIILNFIDSNMYVIINDPGEAYRNLQQIVEKKFPKKDSASTRKSINQFIKLGFVNVGLNGYHGEAKAFVQETDRARKKTLFSKIVYSSSSFNSSFTTRSDVRQINFFVKTLEAVGGMLSKSDAAALMTLNLNAYPEDHADNALMDELRKRSKQDEFKDRKYNQINYFWNLLKNLDDLTVSLDQVYFINDERAVIKEVARSKSGRDSYLQRLYKNQLIEESQKLYSGVVCMVEKLDYPVLIASHIKPYAHSDEIEAFDPNNGILLSKNLDQLFDQGYITFTNDGSILVTKSRNLSEKLTDYLKQFFIDEILLNDKRREYLRYHREYIFYP